MCGIAGIIDTQRAATELRSTVFRMTDTLVHRGPDDAGCFADDGVAIGMRRLSIIDVTGGQQPISNETNEIHVVCNGEIYNYRQLRQELVANGHRFRTNSDAEVIVHLYEQHGDRCFSHLMGMFGIAIWDARHQRMILARDRLGKKPLFISQHRGRLMFASEMKAMLAVEPALSEPDYCVLPEFLQFGYVGEPYTFYRHIQKLPAASVAVCEQGQVTIKRYWDFQFHETSRDEKECREELDDLLLDCVRARLESEVPLGVFLSGGLDSSAIVAYAHRAGLHPLKTFTIGFDRPAWNESGDAADVARHFQTQHHVLDLSESDLRSNLDTTLLDIVRHFDEPFGDDSALPTYHVSRLARQHVTVILSGDGGDELFAGYSSYRGALFAQRYRRWLPYWFGRHVLPNATQLAGRWLPGTLGYQTLRAAKVFRDSALPFASAYRDKVSIWNRDDLGKLLPRQLMEESNTARDQFMSDRLWAIFQSDRDVVSRLTEIDIRSYLLDDILVKVDRMSMAHSLEVRCPLLDHRLVEFAATLPSNFKLKGRHGKSLLRNVVQSQLPARTRKKRKQGFAVPLREWLRGPMADLVHDYLEYDGGRLPEHLFDQGHVQSILGAHRKGLADHSRMIWILLVFAAWHDLYQKGALAPCVASQAF